MAPADPAKPLPLVPYETLMATSVEAVPWLVEPLIARGERVVVYGEWGAYKSWMLLSLALHLAAGRPFLGKFSVTEGKRVLYVDEEMSERLFKRRLQRLAQGMGLKAADALPLKLLSRYGVTSSSLNDLVARAQREGFDPEVVIIETFRRLFRGDENSAKDVAAFWQDIAPLCRAGKTVIVSHHMRKPSLSGRNHMRDRASGSTDILAAADSALALERQVKDAFVVEHVKCREAEEADAIAISFFEESADGPVELHYEGSPADLGGVSGKTPRAEELALAFLRSKAGLSIRTEEILAYLHTQDVSKTTGERALKNLKKAGLVNQPDGRGTYRLTPQSNAG